MKHFTSISIIAAALAGTVTAQQTYTIDPNSVANATRQQWCISQITECPLICLQTGTNSASPLSNTCDANSLTFSCVCSNGLSPNVSEYTQTLPYFICTEWGTQCVSNCGNDNNECASNCRSQHPCGAQNPVRVNTSTISSTMSTTAKASGSGAVTTGQAGTISTGFAEGSASTTGGSGGAAATSKGGASSVRAAALNVGRTFGTLGVIGMIAGGFAILL